jgi:hypothetical protein
MERERTSDTERILSPFSPPVAEVDVLGVELLVELDLEVMMVERPSIRSASVSVGFRTALGLVRCALGSGLIITSSGSGVAVLVSGGTTFSLNAWTSSGNSSLNLKSHCQHIFV